jgi:hypothetical protein
MLCYLSVGILAIVTLVGVFKVENGGVEPFDHVRDQHRYDDGQGVDERRLPEYV